MILACRVNHIGCNGLLACRKNQKRVLMFGSNRNLGMCDQSQLQAMAKLLNIKNNNNSPGPTASGSGTGKAASMTKTTGSSEPASGGKGDRG